MPVLLPLPASSLRFEMWARMANETDETTHFINCVYSFTGFYVQGCTCPTICRTSVDLGWKWKGPAFSKMKCTKLEQAIRRLHKTHSILVKTLFWKCINAKDAEQWIRSLVRFTRVCVKFPPRILLNSSRTHLITFAWSFVRHPCSHLETERRDAHDNSGILCGLMPAFMCTKRGDLVQRLMTTFLDYLPGLLKLVVVDVSLILDLEQKRLLNALRN